MKYLEVGWGLPYHTSRSRDESLAVARRILAVVEPRLNMELDPRVFDNSNPHGGRMNPPVAPWQTRNKKKALAPRTAAPPLCRGCGGPHIMSRCNHTSRGGQYNTASVAMLMDLALVEPKLARLVLNVCPL